MNRQALGILPTRNFPLTARQRFVAYIVAYVIAIAVGEWLRGTGAGRAIRYGIVMLLGGLLTYLAYGIAEWMVRRRKPDGIT